MLQNLHKYQQSRLYYIDQGYAISKYTTGTTQYTLCKNIQSIAEQICTAKCNYTYNDFFCSLFVKRKKKCKLNFKGAQ